MFIPWTMTALAALTAFMIVVRAFWLRVPSRLRWLLIRLAIAVILFQAFFYLTKWATTSAYINVLIYWLAVASYELLVLLFSRFSPRWLTSISAAVLIAPLFASSFLIPLTGIFRPGSIPKTPIGNHLYYKVFPSTRSGPGIQIFDLEVYYRPDFAPFLSRRIGKESFNTGECNASAVFTVNGPGAHTLIARCPHWPTQPPGSVDRLVYLKRM
jgi:hypothetical protein